MKKHLLSFGINLIVASPVIVAFFTAQHFINELNDMPECTINAPREVPRCLPETIDQEAITSLEDSESGLYMACERHDGTSGKPDAKRVVAMLEAQ